MMEPEMHLGHYSIVVTHKKCPKCGSELKNPPIKHYPHEDGYPVKGFDKKQWLYVECPGCEYQIALNKLLGHRTLTKILDRGKLGDNPLLSVDKHRSSNPSFDGE